MTLTEYMNQDDPIRMPDVLLRPDEYKMGVTIQTSREKLTQIFIPSFPGFEYVHIEDGSKSGRLWSTDRHGNPKRMSCFSL